MIFFNSLNFKDILYVLLKLYILFFPFLIVLLLMLKYLSFPFILELLNGLKMLFSIDVAIQKVDESWFENRWVILLENDSVNLISQLQSPFPNFDTENREDEILKFLISPQFLTNLAWW